MGKIIKWFKEYLRCRISYKRLCRKIDKHKRWRDKDKYKVYCDSQRRALYFANFSNECLDDSDFIGSREALYWANYYIKYASNPEGIISGDHLIFDNQCFKGE